MMKKKLIRFITHPILHIVVSVGALWFGANLWLAGGFLAGLTIGLIWGIKGTWTQIKMRYALYPKDQVPVSAKAEDPKPPAQKKITVKKGPPRKRAIVKNRKKGNGK